MSEVTITPDNTVDGGEISQEYKNTELGAKLDDKAVEHFEKKAAEVFGSDYDKVREIIEVLQLLVPKNKDIYGGQIDLVAAATSLVPLVGLRGLDIRNEFALFQALICKKLGFKIEGVQPWEDYFYAEKELKEAEKKAKAK